MKKILFLFLIFMVMVYACNKTTTSTLLGANANITQVAVSVGLTGDTLTVTGTGFSNAGQLRGSFTPSGSTKDDTITVLNYSTTQIIATIPFTLATAGTINIWNGTSTTPITFPFSLSISGTLISQGPSGGSTVTIFGTGFVAGLSGLQVTIAGQTFTLISSTDTSITVSNANVLPQALAGGQLTVGISGQQIKTPFLMGISNINPTTGMAGTPVVITGYGFNTDKTKDIVKFNGTGAVVTSATATQLNVTAPADGSTGPVSVTVVNNTAIGPAFTYPSDVSTFAGSGMSGSADGQGTSASFNAPENGAFDKNGNLFVADYGNNEIRKITPSGAVTTFAGSTKAGFKDGTGSQAQFNGPSGLCFDPQGNLYVSDELNNRIRKIDAAGNVTTVAGSGFAGLFDAPGPSASFNRPIGIAFDSLSAMLFVADSRNNVIRMINSVTRDVFTLAGSTKAGSADEIGGTGATASFNSPRGITLYSSIISGNEWLVALVADYGNNKIRAVQITGTLPNVSSVSTYTLAGDPNNQPGFTNGNVGVKFSGPNNLCLGEYPSISGMTPVLFIADASNHAVRYVLSATGSTVGSTMDFETLAGTGTIGLVNGSYTTAQFKFPDGVAYNPIDGNLYVIEFGNNDIRKIILH